MSATNPRGRQPMKRVAAILRSPQGHWVGDGFPVRSLFSYHAQGAQLSPFLLLDYAGPAEFAPAERPRDDRLRGRGRASRFRR